jgi:hypothetical protein
MVLRVCEASFCVMLFFDVLAQHDLPEGSTHLFGRHRPEYLCVLAAKPHTTSSVSRARHHSDKKPATDAR